MMTIALVNIYSEHFNLNNATLLNILQLSSILLWFTPASKRTENVLLGLQYCIYTVLKNNLNLHITTKPIQNCICTNACKQLPFSCCSSCQSIFLSFSPHLSFHSPPCLRLYSISATQYISISPYSIQYVRVQQYTVCR